MRINPMVKKDIKVQARSLRICWEIFVYEAIMAVVFFFAMFLFSQQMTYSSANIYSSIVWLYPALAVTQIFILGVVVPVRTASAISGEKERQTFDIMMTTSMTGFSIIMGKVAGAEAAPASSCGALADASCSPLLDAAASSVSSSSVISPLSSLSRSSSVRVNCVLSAGASGRVSGRLAAMLRR